MPPGSVARAVVGGPPELDGLLTQLHSSRAFSERVMAVQKLCEILKEYPVRNVLALWSTATDLLGPERPPEAVDAGYALLRRCAALPDLTPVERAVFFKAAASAEDDPHFDTRLQIIRDLTGDGRNIEALESYMATFLLTSLESCFKASRNAADASRKAHGKKRSDQPLKEEENLAQLFQYIIDIIRFNSKIFDEGGLELLLQKFMAICQETTRKRDIEFTIKMVDTLIIYNHIPKTSLKPCLEVLCTIHRQIEELQQSTWNTLTNLFRSHVGKSAVSALLSTLFTGATRKSRQPNIYRGAIHVLQLLLLKDGHDSLPKVPISLLFPALKASIRSENRTHEIFVVRLIAAVLAEDRLKPLLLHQGDWTDLLYIIRTCAERSKARESALIVAPTAGELPRSVAAMVVVPSSDRDSETASTDEPVVASGQQPDVVQKGPDPDISRILACLHAMLDEMDFVQRGAVMELFMSMANRLNDSAAECVVQYFVDERYLHPSQLDWLGNWRDLLSGIFEDSTRPRSLRLSSLRSLTSTHSTVAGICTEDTFNECTFLLLNQIEEEKDILVLHELVNFAVEVADEAHQALFLRIIDVLKTRLERTMDQSPQAPINTPPITFAASVFKDQHSLGSASNVLVTGLVRLFIRSITKSSTKTSVLFDRLLEVAGSNSYESDARLSALKLLFRLRADANHAISVNPSSEGESIASVLCRTAETAVVSDKFDDSTPSDVIKQDELSWRETRKGSNTSPHSSLNRHTSRHGANTGRVSRPIPPLWMYPGPKGLPEEPSSRSSGVVFSISYAGPSDEDDVYFGLKVALWLELVISLLQKSPDWEIYSYVLVHLGPQLSNKSLFEGSVRQIKMLRSVICEQIRGSTFQEPPSHTLLKKADAAVCLIHILTILISYHALYEKSEEDELVRAFLHGIGSWDRTSKWCIHALTVCCHEMPLSVSKSLENIIQKMSQIITQPHIAIHILEFLTTLARLPELYKNFREDEFKTVFGVSFRYIQYVRDQRERSSAGTTSPNNAKTLRHSGPSRDFAVSAEQVSRTKPKSTTDDLPQYVYALAFHVITFWFMALKMPERAKQIPWIMKNLVYTDRFGKEITEEQSQVILDMMHMVAYSDRDETKPRADFAKPSDGEVLKKTWIVGHSIVTIETACTSGASQITTRRACGTRYSKMRPLLTEPPRHQVPITTGPASDAFERSGHIALLPDDIFQNVYSPFIFPFVPGQVVDPPIPLPEDDMSRRAIDAFDRNPTVDGHKVGVIYIGEGQTSEREILLNSIGSPDYTAFVADLGTLVRLKGAKINAGGLDTRDDVDGEFTICWRDRCMELVFHITTIMPTNDDEDLTYANKKRHIGNDFVNIIFNDSGLPYDFDTFPSAFNYVHIVITPESRASFVQRRRDAADSDGQDRYYKVQVIPKPGFPDISPAAESKIISGRNLAAYVRLMALNASVFSQVWYIKDGGEAVSSWRNRLREIKRLRERYGGAMDSSPSSPLNTYPASGGASGPAHTLTSPQSRETMAAFKRTSVTTFISEGTSRSSIASGHADAE